MSNRPTSRLALALAAAAMLASLAVLVFLSRGARASDQRPDSAAHAATSRGAEAPQLTAPRVADGNQYVYALHTSHRLDNLSAAGESHATDLVVAGTLAHVKLDDAGAEYKMQLTPASVALMIGGKNRLDARTGATLRAELSAPVFMSVDEHGRVQAVHMTTGMSALAARTLKTLAADLQFVRGDTDGGATWVADESSATGQLRARYTADSATRFTKTTIEYTSLANDGSARRQPKAQVEVESSASTIVLDKARRITSLDRNETVRMTMMSGKMSVRHTERTKLSLLRIQVVPNETLANQLSGLISAPLDRFLPRKQDPRNFERQLLGGATLSSLLTALDGANNGHARGRVLVKLRAIFRLDPTQLAAASRTLKTLSPTRAATIIGAMGSAGTPAAQASLIDIAHNRHLSDVSRGGAIAHLGTVDKPTADTVTALVKGLESTNSSLQNRAVLALGNAGNKLATDQPARASAILELLRARIANSSDPSAVAQLVTALGNVGTQAVLADLTRAASHRHPRVRLAAVSALRGIPGAPAQALLTTLSSDRVGYVARAASHAVTYRARH